MMFSQKTVQYALQEPGNNQIKVIYKLLFDNIPKGFLLINRNTSNIRNRPINNSVKECSHQRFE